MATANLVIGNGVSNLTIAVDDTTPMSQRAIDATADINAAFPATPTFKVVWGFKIVAGYNDTIIHAANLSGVATNVTGTIAAGNYSSGQSLAVAMQTAMQAAEDAFAGGKRVDITVTYNDTTGKFNWAWVEVRSPITQFIIRGSVDYSVTALATVGIQRGSDQVGAGASGNFDGDYEVRNQRFAFTFAGLAGSVRLADAAFTAEAFFGITDTTNQTIAHYLCNSEMIDVPTPDPPAPPSIPSFRPAQPLVRGGGGSRVFPIVPPKQPPPPWEKNRTAIEAEWKTARQWAWTQRVGGWSEKQYDEWLDMKRHELRAKYGVPDKE